MSTINLVLYTSYLVGKRRSEWHLACFTGVASHWFSHVRSLRTLDKGRESEGRVLLKFFFLTVGHFELFALYKIRN